MEINEVESYVKAGEIAKEVKEFAKELVKPGTKLIDIAEAIDAKIAELGGEPAFPVNLSLNEIAAHFTPAKGDEIVAEGILKVDLGVAVNGYIADTAFSVDLTKDGKFEEMMKLNEKLVLKLEKLVRKHRKHWKNGIKKMIQVLQLLKVYLGMRLVKIRFMQA